MDVLFIGGTVAICCQKQIGPLTKLNGILGR